VKNYLEDMPLFDCNIRRLICKWAH